MNRRHRSWWDTLTSWGRAASRVLLVAEYSAIEVFAASAFAGFGCYAIARMT